MNNRAVLCCSRLFSLLISAIFLSRQNNTNVYLSSLSSKCSETNESMGIMIFLDGKYFRHSSVSELMLLHRIFQLVLIIFSSLFFQDTQRKQCLISAHKKYIHTKIIGRYHQLGEERRILKIQESIAKKVLDNSQDKEESASALFN